MTRILILCTGNSCRSQMAEGFLKSLDGALEVSSAGTRPALQINPHAVAVMKEVGIDISREEPKSVDQFTHRSFDYVITVCDHAKETCPVFTGKVGQRLHFGFEDPAAAPGSPDEVLATFRRVRDKIQRWASLFYAERLRQ